MSLKTTPHSGSEGRLDLTVEALIHDNPQWHPLVTPEELDICTERLTQYEYLG